MLHGEKAAKNSEQAAKEAFSGNSLGSNLLSVHISLENIDKKINVLDLILLSKLENSKSEIRRLIKGNAIRINDNTISDEKFIIDQNLFKENYLKLSIGKKRHIKVELKYFFLIFYIVRVINLGVNVLIGFTVVSSFLGGPLILKLTPKTPSPVLSPTKILPRTGIELIVLLIVVAGTSVPLRLISLSSSTYPLINIEIAGPIA